MTYLATLKKKLTRATKKVKEGKYILPHFAFADSINDAKEDPPPKNMVSSIRFTRLLVQPIFRNCIYFAASAFFNFTRLS